jgi:heme oxygenase
MRFRAMNVAVEAPAGARTLLREACAEAHARLDGRLSKLNFDDREAYAAVLSRMSGPLSAYEGALTAGVAPALFANWSGRLRSYALRADLEALGGSFRQTRRAPLEDEAAALGALYVLEGSRLGGQVLARMAEASADEGVRGATRYFRHGQGGALWRGFIETLENSDAVRARPHAAAQAALDTFAAFEAALT